jgi:hypothetical protein
MVSRMLPGKPYRFTKLTPTPACESRISMPPALHHTAVSFFPVFPAVNFPIRSRRPHFTYCFLCAVSRHAAFSISRCITLKGRFSLKT